MTDTATPAGGEASPPPSNRQPAELGTLGMWLFILSLTVLFAASISGYVVIRSRADQWPPKGMPPLPSGLWFSTAIIIVCSAFIQYALHCARKGKQSKLLAALLGTSLFSVVFLVSQAANWAWLIGMHATIKAGGLYTFSFYLLTGLHAAHVIGGLIFLGFVTARAFVGTYGPDRYQPVKYATMYWHFLGIVWLAMFVVMFLI